MTTVNRMHVTGQLMTTEEAKIIEDGLPDIDSGCPEECGTASSGRLPCVPRIVRSYPLIAYEPAWRSHSRKRLNRANECGSTLLSASAIDVRLTIFDDFHLARRHELTGHMHTVHRRHDAGSEILTKCSR